MDRQEFTFYAHVLGSTDERDFVTSVKDDGNRPFVDLADDAEEKAYEKAAKIFGVSAEYIEVRSA